MKEKFELLVTMLITIIVKAVDRLEAGASKIREYLRDNKDIQQGKKTWQDFWEHKKQNPGAWQNSDPEKALRNLLGWILCGIYVLMFVWGVVMVEARREREKDPASILTRPSNSANTADLSPREDIKYVTVDGKTYAFENETGK